MSKKIENINFDKDTNRIYINENDVKPGDYIILDNISIIESYLTSSNKYYKATISHFKENDLDYKQLENNYKKFELENENLKKQLETSKTNAINEFKSSEEYVNLNKKNTQLEIEIKNAHDKAINEFKNSEEYLNLNKKNIELEEKIKIAHDKAINEFKNSEEYKKIIDENKENIKKYYEEKDNNQKILKEKDEKISQLEQEKKEIQNSRNLLNIKKMGEDFEIWCKNEYEKAYQYLDDSIFEKTTKEKNGTKPDFIFEVFSNNVNENKNNEVWRKNNSLGRVIFEMKTESMDSDPKNRKSNEFHLEKLEKERKNFEADFAILVSELEKEDDFIIKRPTNYRDIYIIRPQAFISIIGFFRMSILKRKEIKKLELNFEEKQKIIADFEEFKNSILNNAIKNIKSNCENIKKKADDIIKSGEDIIKTISVVQETHLNTIINKIEKFNINKITKDIDKVNQNNLLSSNKNNNY